MVQWWLEELGVPYVLLDQRSFGDAEVELRVSDSNVTGELAIADKRYSLENFVGVYTRLMESDLVPAAYEGEGDVLRRLHCRAVYDALLAWFEISPARVVNRSAPMD